MSDTFQKVAASGIVQEVVGIDVNASSENFVSLFADLVEAFSEYGPVKNIHVNLDRRTGFVKGYGLVEYASRTEAQDAINALHGTQIMGKTIGVDWAFVQHPHHQHSSGRGGGGGGRRRRRRWP